MNCPSPSDATKRSNSNEVFQLDAALAGRVGVLHYAKKCSV
jgi:hypothetical protein